MSILMTKTYDLIPLGLSPKCLIISIFSKNKEMSTHVVTDLDVIFLGMCSRTHVGIIRERFRHQYAARRRKGRDG